MSSFTQIPQELIYEIFGYVPEYGHRVNRDLHERSKTIRTVSVYCDLLRYCARMSGGPIEICNKVIGLADISGDIKIDAIGYLKKNLRGLLSMYLDNRDSVLIDTLIRVGIDFADKLSNVDCGYYEPSNLYGCLDTREKVIKLYSLMIIRDAGLMTKKEFEAGCLKVGDLEIVLEIMFGVFDYNEHIYRVSIRYFSSEPIMPKVIERLNSMAAITEGILADDDDYIYDPRCLTQFMEYNDQQKKMDRSSLRKVRDQLLRHVPKNAYYSSVTNNNVNIQVMLFMLDSLADEE